MYLSKKIILIYIFYFLGKNVSAMLWSSSELHEILSTSSQYPNLSIADILEVNASSLSDINKKILLEQKNSEKKSTPDYKNQMIVNLKLNENSGMCCNNFEESILLNVNFTNANQKYTSYNGATIINSILENANLEGVEFIGTKFLKSSLKKIRLKNTNLSFVIFEKVNLEEADFTNALMLGVTFKNVEVKNANFKNARCLTNDQKEFLRKNGAMNVPADLSDEELKKEIKRATKQCLFCKWCCCGPCCLTYKIAKKIKKCWCGKVKEKKDLFF